MSRILSAIFVVLLSSWGLCGDNRWTTNGPFGGYFLTFAFDPQNAQTVYVSGGDSLFRSRNAGQLWERLDISGTTGFPAAFTVRFTPGSPSRMLAAGTSVFASTNQGTSWTELAHTPAGDDQFYDIEFHPSNPQTLYGVTYRHGFLRSNDGGASWTAKSAGMNIRPKTGCCDLPQVEVDPTNGSIVYALLSSRILYKSTNGGDSWKALPGLKLPQSVNSLVLDPRNPQTLYAGGFDGIYKTTNGGTTWASTQCACGIFSVAMDPRNTQTLYAVSDSAIKTTNGGGSWTNLSAPVPQGGSWLGSAVHPANGAVFAGGFGTGIFRSADGGRTWKEFTQRLDEQYIENVVSSPQAAVRLFATSPPLAFSSANSGGAWGLVRSLTLDPRSLDVAPSNANLVASAGDPSGFGISTDAGKTWSFRGPYHDVRQYCTDCVKFHTQNPDTIYLAPSAAGMARSNDRGATWAAINSGLTEKNISVVEVDPRDGSTVFAGTPSGKIFKTTNGGGVWKNSSGGIQPGYVLAIEVDPGNSNVVYASVDRQPDHALIYKSTNGGTSWTQKSSGLDGHYSIRSIAVDPAGSSTVYAAGEAGVFVSADAGENWSAFDSTGLSPFYIFDVFINPAQPQTLWLGTDRGVYAYTRKSTPGGPSIAQIAPAAAKAGDTVTIQGSGFGSAQGGSAVSFNGTSAGTAASWAPEDISVRVPSGARSGPVTVTVNGKRSNPFAFQVLAASGNIEPASGPSGGGTTVTILGPPAQSRLALNVLFGKNVGRSLRFTPPNIYTCITPPGSGTVDVIIVSGVSSFHAGTYTYQ